MKFTTLASIAFVVVLLSSTAPIKSEFQSLSTKPPCTTIDITECVPAIIFGAQLSPDCCQNLKVQQPCYCGFINNAGLRPYITSPQGHAALASCGIPFPGGIYTLVPDSSSSLSCCCSTRYSRAGQKDQRGDSSRIQNDATVTYYLLLDNRFQVAILNPSFRRQQTVVPILFFSFSFSRRNPAHAQ
ncbi:unnamed protein product [Brassica rapa]|uniref:Bifunctional inhibitor/plant lipid transfer protein/seed storage helical domain-containing protein n=2 Tax=Brassica TaxID=3705 RepID=A0A3P6B6F4_BRACM|nr:unnamed protein product [Brassica napus]CAG7895499.1 unnamed protein product [Brassica rapa]CDY44406.1 BnaA02g29710D [Brassica napus]VDC92061.1 unnamed protein product [Brassica rapa]